MARPHLLLSYDGANPETYQQLRHSAKVLEVKKKAIENLAKTPRSHVSFVTLFGWELNHKELPQLLEFYHQHRAMLHGVYLMPLVHTWDASQFDYKPERMTTECVEKLLDDVYPDTKVEFISLGLASHYVTVMKYLGKEAMPYYGAHPNCESFYALVDDGEKYLPIDRYLRTSLPGFAGNILKIEKTLIAREERWQKSLVGRALGALRLRNFALRALGLAQLGLTALPPRPVGPAGQGMGAGEALPRADDAPRAPSSGAPPRRSARAISRSPASWGSSSCRSKTTRSSRPSGSNAAPAATSTSTPATSSSTTSPSAPGAWSTNRSSATSPPTTRPRKRRRRPKPSLPRPRRERRRRILMDFCTRNDKPVLVGQASCLPNLALQAGSLHHKRPNLIIPCAEVNRQDVTPQANEGKMDLLHRVLALTGRNGIAQGEALGGTSKNPESPEGASPARESRRGAEGPMSRPFRA